MLDLFVVLCDHKDCRVMATVYRYEDDAISARDTHTASFSYEDDTHEAYLVTLVARKYAR